MNQEWVHRKVKDTPDNYSCIYKLAVDSCHVNINQAKNDP